MEGGDPVPGELEVADAEAAARADEALDRFLPPQDGGVQRQHHVTALVVAHQGATWLPRTLEALTGQSRRPDQVIAVDAGSTDGSAELLEGAAEHVLAVSGREGLAAALRGAARVDRSSAATARSAQHANPGGDATIRWYWIIHDDSAPHHGCLAALLAGADRAPAASVLVPKSVAWSDPGRLVGIGNPWAPGRPVVELLEPRERDQGQYDVDRPVYSGDSAGMLVRADMWHALGGMDPAVGDWAGPADLCRRVWSVGGEVMFIPAAVVAHRQAGHRAARPSDPPDPAPRRAARHGQLLLELTQAPAPALPWRWARGWVSTVLRALALLLTREPEEASAELAGAWDALARPGRLHAARRSVRASTGGRVARPAQVRAARGAVLNHSLDAWAAASRRAGALGRRTVPRAVWLPLAVAGALAVLAVVRDPATLAGSGTLRGGGLLPAPGAGQVLDAYLASWQDVRFGAPSAQPAYLPLLAAASLPLLGSVDLLLRLVVTLAVPLAFLSAYASVGPFLAGYTRWALALVWALLPAGVAAAGAGRISTLALLLLGPPTARLLVDAVLRARRGERATRPAIAAGTLLGVTAAFAPLAGLLTLATGLLVWLLARLPGWPVRTGVIITATTAVFVGLWAPRLLAAPWLLLSDLGRNDPSLTEPAPQLLALSPGGPTAVPWVGAGVVVLAITALLVVRPSASRIAAVVGALLLLAMAGWTPAAVAALWPQAPAGAVWPGQAALLAGGVLALAAARALGPGSTGDSASAASSWLAGPVPVAAWAACTGLLVVGWWVAPTQVRVGTGTGLPAVVGLAEGTDERPRALVLTRGDVAEGVVYAVSASATAWIGSADAMAAPELDPAFDDVVEALVSGAGGDLEGELGGRGIRYVVFDGPQDDSLVAELDSAIGLRRLASAAEQSLWLVSGQPVRSDLITGADDPGVVVPISTTPTSIDVVLHPEARIPSTLRLAEKAHPGWRAGEDGMALELAADPRGMLTAPVTESGRLQVVHRSPWTYLATGQLAAMAALALLALPKRRALDLDGEAAP